MFIYIGCSFQQYTLSNAINRGSVKFTELLQDKKPNTVTMMAAESSIRNKKRKKHLRYFFRNFACRDLSDFACRDLSDSERPRQA